MKKRIAPLQIGSLARSVFIVLLILTLAWSVISLLVFGDILINQFLLVANLVLSVILGWLFYRYYSREVFIYDEKCFELHKGRRSIEGRWNEFSRVSLVHVGGGNFVVRLYHTGDDSLDLPASALRLDPYQLRFEIIRLLSGKYPET